MTPAQERRESLAFARGIMIGLPISLAMWCAIIYTAIKIWS